MASRRGASSGQGQLQQGAGDPPDHGDGSPLFGRGGVTEGAPGGGQPLTAPRKWPLSHDSDAWHQACDPVVQSKRTRLLPDKGKPIASGGRKARGQPNILMAGLQRKGIATSGVEGSPAGGDPS